MYNDREYKFYVVDPDDLTIMSGWEYREDAVDAVNDEAEGSREAGFDAPQRSVYTAGTLRSKGADPDDDDNWMGSSSRPYEGEPRERHSWRPGLGEAELDLNKRLSERARVELDIDGDPVWFIVPQGKPPMFYIKGHLRRFLGEDVTLTPDGPMTFTAHWTGRRGERLDAPVEVAIKPPRVGRQRNELGELGELEGDGRYSRFPGPKEGTRVRFSPNPASRMLYTNPPPVGDEGRVTTTLVPTGRGMARRTYMAGPGGGLVYVNWNRIGVMGVALQDIERI